MSKYELTLVFDGKAGGGKKKKVEEMLSSFLKVYKGKIVESSDWGVRDLAYKLKKSTSGLYLYFVLELEPKAVRALSDKLRLDEETLRYLIVKA